MSLPDVTAVPPKLTVKIRDFDLPEVKATKIVDAVTPLVDQHELPSWAFDVPATIPIPNVLGPTVSHRKWQSPAKTQGARGTCWAFAGIAALEAAYRRQGVKVELSEQYFFHAVKSWGNQSPWLPNEVQTYGSSLVGFGGSADSVHHLARINVPLLAAARYVDQAGLWTIAGDVADRAGALTAQVQAGAPDKVDWFEYDEAIVPLTARWQANYGVKEWGTAQGTVDGIKAVLDAGYDAVVDVKDKTLGNGGHVILIYGYDDRTGRFLIKNSQSKDSFETMLYSGDGHFDLAGATVYFVKEVKPVAPQIAAAWIGPWTMSIDGTHGRLVIRAFVNLWWDHNDIADDPSRTVNVGTWYPENGAPVVVNGWYATGGRILNCTINGQRFELCLHSREIDRASGRTWWNGGEFGVVATRGIVSAGPALAQSTRASATAIWEMDHDGVRGTLRNGDDPSYIRAGDGEFFHARALGGQNLRFDLEIDWAQKGLPPQKFEFLPHTRETSIAGGLTWFGGLDYGVTASEARSIYVVRDDGQLDQYRHIGRPKLSGDWQTHAKIGVGWAGARIVCGAGDGIVYTIDQEGRLFWYWHRGRSRGTFDWEGARQVGEGWQGITQLIAGDGGLLYGIDAAGTVSWFHHLGRRDGTGRWDGPRPVGTFAPRVRSITAAPDGVFYGIDPSGQLLWWRHTSRAAGRPFWAPPKVVGIGWNEVDKIWATGSGYLYGRFGSGSRRGQLWAWNHLGFLDGSFHWRDGKQVGTGWIDGVKAIFAT